MSAIVCRVISQTECASINTQKGEQMDKCFIRLKEIGGEYSNEYYCAVLGNLAQCLFQDGDKVMVTLKFRLYENNGSLRQDVLATDIIKVNM